DASGAAYVTGYTKSSDFPTQNSYQSTYGGGYMDVFITKLSSSGNSLVYSTYLGGSGYDEGDGIAVDASEMAYVIGYTSSLNFPTQNPYQGAHDGGNVDVFITKLSSGGNSLVYSTYLGGSDDDHGYSIAVDVTGAAYVTGSTSSLDFPTQNSYQSTYGGGLYNTFISKLNSIGNSMVYSTYLGASGGEEGKGIAVDASGAAYVIGYTYSSDFPTLNSYQGTYQGSGDIFVTKLSSGCCVGIRGNVDGDPDDKVNVADVIYIANYAFAGGNPPVCNDEADINGDGSVNIADVTYLANYAFANGPAPVACP
ncbi:MAG: hypothetical protein GXO93_02430, partial [FCB group bacterium]|nr:hypothetical protein [FCB group bacterium]